MTNFICAKQKGDGALCFRKIFISAKGLASVTASISAVGLVKGYINGREFDSDVLSPGWTDYRIRIPYYTFDITDKVTEGRNCLVFIVGNGWGAGKIAWFGKELYSDRPLFWAEIKITYTDGSTESFGSDKTFKVSSGKIVGNDIFDGETWDCRLEDEGAFFAGFDDSAWENAEEAEGRSEKLEPAVAPLTKEQERFEGKLLSKKGKTSVYDFGCNHAGIVRLKIKSASEGERITVRYGEMLNEDGSVYTENLRTAKCTDVCVCKKGDNFFRPIFTYHGYRYASVETDGEGEVEEIYSRAIYTDMEACGSFSCSDELVNKLFENIRRSMKSNFVNIPTDCPQRDERLGWSGDCQIFCKTAMYLADCRQFFRKYLCDVRDAQREDGMIDLVAPAVSPDFDGVKGAPAWGDVITVLPYEYYLVYKDKSVVEENLPAGKRWVDYCVASSEDYIRPPIGYGDWLSVGDATDKSVLGTLYMAYSAKLVSKMCGIAGDSDARKYSDIYERVKRAFRKRFVGEENAIESDTQTAYLLAYAFGVMTADEIRSNLLRTIRRRENHLSTGFVGVKFLLPVLSELGETELAYELLTKTDYPSWLYPVMNGATTVWERWNSYTIGSGFADRGMNSFNHYSLGSVGEWLFSGVLGLRFTEEGIVISPAIDESGRISRAKGEYALGEKRIRISWKRLENGYTEVSAEAPEGVRVLFDGYSEAKKRGNKYFVKR